MPDSMTAGKERSCRFRGRRGGDRRTDRGDPCGRGRLQRRDPQQTDRHGGPTALNSRRPPSTPRAASPSSPSRTRSTPGIRADSVDLHLTDAGRWGRADRSGGRAAHPRRRL